MGLDSEDYKMLQTEFRLIGSKLDLLNEHVKMIQKTTYQMLMEQVKTNVFLETLVEVENRKFLESKKDGKS